MMNKTKKALAVLAVAAVASLGAIGPSSAASDHAPAKKDRSTVVFKIGDPWCC